MKKLLAVICSITFLASPLLFAIDYPEPDLANKQASSIEEPVFSVASPSLEELWAVDPASANGLVQRGTELIVDLSSLWDAPLTGPSENIVFHPIASLAQSENEIQSDAVDQVVPVALRNNEYYRESERLKKLSDEAFEYGDYDAAVNYAAEAAKAAQRSDEYVALQLLMRKVNNAIFTANTRLNWASSIGAEKTYADKYSAAQAAYAQAINFRAEGQWDESYGEAQKVISLLSNVYETLPLPATYVVRPWASTRDCFWTIAKYSFVYNNPYRWRALYDANRTKLRQPNNPDLVHVGTVLSIPSIKGEYREGRWMPGREYPVFGK